MVMGRVKETEQLIETLLKRRKSNACLVGEAGVGKTAIVEGLAIMIARGSVPPPLRGKKVITVVIHGKGKTIDFTNTMVILTSNANLGTSSKFKPELLNRFDQVVAFKPLDKGHMEEILEIAIDEFRARVAAKKNIGVEVGSRLKEKLIVEGYDQRYGARAIKRAVASLVEDKLAEEIINGSVAQHSAIVMDVALTGELVCVSDPHCPRFLI